MKLRTPGNSCTITYTILYKVSVQPRKHHNSNTRRHDQRRTMRNSLNKLLKKRIYRSENGEKASKGCAGENREADDGDDGITMAPRDLQ